MSRIPHLSRPNRQFQLETAEILLRCRRSDGNAPARFKPRQRLCYGSPAGGRGSRGPGRRLLVRLGLLDGRPLPGLDRRRLCEGRQHHHRAEGLRLPAQVLVGDNEHVKAGQVLARIDDRDFKVALDQAKADVAAAQAAVASKRAQLDAQQAVIEAAKATLDVDKASADLRRAGEQALHRSRRHRLWQRAERAAGAVARSPRAGRDRSATPRILPPRKSRSTC